ncbi:MAG: cell division protein ZapA [Thermodesulfobacteriota bacterium]
MFGRDYTVKGHGNRKYVEKLTEFINGKAEEIQRRARVVSTLDLVILTLLNVTDELFHCRKGQDTQGKEPEEQAAKLLKESDHNE